ncbi:alpha/beta hydrolase [Gordonia sp. PP30]|uniref:esterase/lipase family protein n=1 Tax=unclassified Gordonia (in: high G+C Gram-positive bacteria) TaxID=2657482 RepID=UPI001FFF2C06|nr:alpha/beta hydrolase [Gordonia sp. PP30]UQE74257.1 alpha/beta hydrolase [Gordonia sp. PP30]
MTTTVSKLSGSNVKSPRLLMWASDGPRATMEFATYLSTWPAMLAAPVSDDLQPILVLPGLGTADVNTVPLRQTLRRLGYPTYGWRLGVNIGPSAKITAGMRDRLAEVYERHQAPVSVIGWSLGGIYARQLARETPEMIRQVITLGSPIKLERHSQSNARHLYNLLRRFHVTDLQLPLEADAPPLPMPSTAFYSRTDGIVAWQACRDNPGPMAENIEVLCSHFGFGHNLPTVWAIADRLALPAAESPAPFRPPRWMRYAYPGR